MVGYRNLYPRLNEGNVANMNADSAHVILSIPTVVGTSIMAGMTQLARRISLGEGIFHEYAKFHIGLSSFLIANNLTVDDMVRVSNTGNVVPSESFLRFQTETGLVKIWNNAHPWANLFKYVKPEEATHDAT